MSFQTNLDYFYRMFPYAKQAAAGTGVPVAVILAQWAHETGFGTSDVAKNANNHGGIKYADGFSIADGKYGAYAKYNTLDKFVQDYIRVMNLSYYADVRAAGSDQGAIDALGMSPYAEDPAYSSKISGIYSVYGLSGFNTYQGGAAPSGGGQAGQDTAKLAAIGAAAVALFALLAGGND